MDLAGLKPILRTPSSYSALTPVPDMTYNVFDGSLNLNRLQVIPRIVKNEKSANRATSVVLLRTD